MKRRIITVASAAIVLLALTAASPASAGNVFLVSGSGVLMPQENGYTIAGLLRDVNSQNVGTIHGRNASLVELRRLDVGSADPMSQEEIERLRTAELEKSEHSHRGLAECRSRYAAVPKEPSVSIPIGASTSG
jgi:hypothetical protein